MWKLKELLLIYFPNYFVLDLSLFNKETDSSEPSVCRKLCADLRGQMEEKLWAYCGSPFAQSAAFLTGTLSGSGSQVGEILATYVIAFLRHWANAYMSRRLANELLVTWAVLVTPDLCSAQDPVSSHHNQFSLMNTCSVVGCASLKYPTSLLLIEISLYSGKVEARL